MTDKLSLFNGALQVLGSRKLTSLTEQRRAAQELHLAWDGGLQRQCLEVAQWRLAVRTERLEYEPSIEPEFGYRYAFLKSDDWVRTCAVCADEYFRATLEDYSDERGYIWSDLDEIFVKFVSDDAAYGGDLSTWPQSFCVYVHHELALKAGKGIKGISASEIQNIEKDRDKTLAKAMAIDAMNQPAGRNPPGTWSTARRGSNARRDLGRRTRLIG